VSYSKFAPITESLLSRKGEAAPSLGAKRVFGWGAELKPARDHIRNPVREPIPERIPEPAPVVQTQIIHPEIHQPAAKPSSLFEKPRRVVVSFSACEFERLGIAAVKKGLSRHDLVRDTMNEYMKRLAKELNFGCACLNAAGNAACSEAFPQD